MQIAYNGMVKRIGTICLLLWALAYGQIQAQPIDSTASPKGPKHQELQELLRRGHQLVDDDPEQALEYALQALTLTKRQGSKLHEAEALSLMGQSSMGMNHPDNALRYYTRALSCYEQLADPHQQAQTLMHIASVHLQTHQLELAQQALKRAEPLLGNPLLSSTSRTELLQLLAQMYRKQGNNIEAKRSYSALLHSIEHINPNNQATRLSCIIELGHINKDLGNLDESLNRFQQAADMALEMRDSALLAHTLHELGMAHFLLERYTNATKLFREMLSLSANMGDTTSMILALQSIGDVHFERAEIPQAIGQYSQQLAMAQQYNRTISCIEALVRLSQCHYAQNDYPQSTALLNQALTLVQRERLSESKADVYRYLALTYEKEKRYKQALNCYKMWSELRDSIHNETTGQRIAKMQLLYDISQKERDNESLRQNAQMQQLQLHKTRYGIIILVTATLVLLLLLTIILTRFKAKRLEIRRKEEEKEKIQLLNQQLERRMLEEIKKQEQQQLLLAQKSKLESLGNLAAGIAHEINQPLGGISMALDNLLLRIQEQSCSEEYLKTKIENIFQNVDRIKRIIDHVRNFSRAQKPISFEQTNVNDVVRNALFMVAAQFENHGVKLTSQLDDRIGPITADKYKLEQVLLNLLSNAKHAVDEKAARPDTPQGFQRQIDIKTLNTPTEVLLTVRDNGVGIPQKVIDKIFDPFFTTKTEEHGTGLGLSISYNFIKDILGDIRVDSQEGEYTLFEIVMPKI